MKLLLVHGGLWEDMTADRFWRDTGVLNGLTEAGHDCIAPDRLRRPATWREDADHLIQHTPDEPFAIVAASNGSTPAIETAIAAADRITGLLLAWPATQGDQRVDDYYRRGMRADGGTDNVIDGLLAGETLRGLSHDRIRQLPDIPTGLVPAPPDSPTHQRHTIDALARLVPRPDILPTFPEAPRPDFPAVRGDFLTAVGDWLAGLNRSERHLP